MGNMLPVNLTQFFENSWTWIVYILAFMVLLALFTEIKEKLENNDKFTHEILRRLQTNELSLERNKFVLDKIETIECTVENLYHITNRLFTFQKEEFQKINNCIHSKNAILEQTHQYVQAIYSNTNSEISDLKTLISRNVSKDATDKDRFHSITKHLKALKMEKEILRNHSKMLQDINNCINSKNIILEQTHKYIEAIDGKTDSNTADIKALITRNVLKDATDKDRFHSITTHLKGNHSTMQQEIKKLTTLLQKAPLRPYDENFNSISNNLQMANTIPSCFDAIISNDNNAKDDIYLLKIPQSDLRPFYAYCCRHIGHGWTIIQRRTNGAVNFFKNWKDYKDGFGDLYGDYWLGLERLYAMTTQQPHELWIQIRNYESLDAKYALYDHFKIGSESEGYQLTVSGYSGTAGDTLGAHHNGLRFSTYDRNNVTADYTNNVAAEHQGAWWFYRSLTCHLNGPYQSYANRKTNYGVFWSIFNEYKDSLQYVHMAIRPKNLPDLKKITTEKENIKKMSKKEIDELKFANVWKNV